MISKSDVSKMLVSHHSGRQGSVTSCSSHKRRASSRLSDTSYSRSKAFPPRSLPQGSPLTRTALDDEVKESPKAVKKISGLTTELSVRKEKGVGMKGQETQNSNLCKSYGFLQMKCLEILKASSTPLHIHDIQIALGPNYNITHNKEFIARIKANPRITIDPVTKRWSFKSPYEHLTGPDAILKHLKHKGFELNSEALEYNKDISVWVNELLVQRRCRAVRGKRVARCKVFSAESGFFCDLYKPDSRCEACRSLQGVILYPLGPESIENLVIDADIKELWHKLPQKSLAELETIMGVDRRKHNTLNSTLRTKKRKPVGGRTPRVQRIVNMHMYTREDINEALAMTAS